MRKMNHPLLAFVLGWSLILAACGGGGEGVSGAAGGEELFAQASIGSQPGCITCHSLDPDVVLVGPSLAGIGGRAGSTVPGMSAEEYIRESILEPNAHVVEGFYSDVMPQAFGEELSEEEVDNLVAYLLTLK